jgi:RNA polymerase sigma-70 factor, ECF subfamily
VTSSSVSGATPSLDRESRAWVAELTPDGDGRVREEAVARLHSLLLHAARHTIARRRTAYPSVVGDLDDLALEAADDALVMLLGRLDTFRGESRFTTWAYGFAVLEASVKLRRLAWQAREVPLETDRWRELVDPASSLDETFERGELLRAVCDAIERALTPHQRRVLVAVVLNDVPIDVLAGRLGSTRGALYKTIHDARRRIRAHLRELGIAPDDSWEPSD